MRGVRSADLRIDSGDRICPALGLQQWTMPLAHPTTATTTSDFADEMLVVRFMTARPGESAKGFAYRVAHPHGSVLGMMRRPRQSRVEFILNRSSAKRLGDQLETFLTCGKPTL